MHKPPLRRLLVVSLLGVAVALVVVFVLWRESPPPSPQQTRARSETRKLANKVESTPTAVPTTPVASPASSPSLPDLPSDLPVARGTVEDLMAKGFPLMSNPTKAAYTQTAGQTIAQVVADLGNMMTILYTADLNTRAYKKELRHWRTRIPMNTKVLRLIEEGRRSASEVAPLLRSAVKNCIALYDEAAEAWDQTLVAMWKAGGPPPMKKVTGDNDPYYAQHRRYEAPTLEFYRIHYVAYAALYCLANIGELDAETLGAWMNLDKHPRLNCPDLNVWLIDCYFQQGRATNAAAAARHYQLTQGQSLSGQRIVQSKWNAGWDIHEPLLAARDVDTRDIQRIEVLDIPSHLPISDQTKEQIVANFVESVSQKR